MTAAPLLPYVKPGMKRPPPAARTARLGSSVASSSERDELVAHLFSAITERHIEPQI